MKANDSISGFTLISRNAVQDINGEVYTFTHDKTGATLYYLKREDRCKTFAIGFKTVPKDDTGVFHIIEHSVLCGSEKYPVKDPFTEVMKGSVNVYMNAHTAPDKTYYPISTTNEQDFYNLISVYLDAVFNPLMLKNKSIFLREGVRTELDEDGKAVYGGVVYNEMTGAYSRVEEEANYILSRLVFPNGTYSFDTGGHPDKIPELTYKDFCDTYREFYHPSNSCIVLDGSLDLNKTLSLIDTYLCPYGKRECAHAITLGGATITEMQRRKYVMEGHKKTDAGYLFLSYRILNRSSVEDSMALSLIADSLADTNNSPLKKEVMELSLCDNFHLYVNTDLKYTSVDVEFTGVKDGMENELLESFRAICRKYGETGPDPRLIEAALNSMEFRAREADYGSTPKGMIYLGCCFDAWCYNYTPESLLSYGEAFKSLKNKLGTDYFKELTRELILPEEYASLLMLPDENLHSEIANRRSLDCERGLNERGRDAVLNDTVSFYAWQDEEDSPEALAKIPCLKLDDLKGEPKETPTVLAEKEGVRIIAHPLYTSDIIYLELYFDVSDLAEKDIYAAQLMCAVLADLDTVKGSAADFATRKKEQIGSLYVSMEPIKSNGEPKLYLCLRATALTSKADRLTELISEHLYGRILANFEVIKQKIAQISETSEAQLASHGTTYAILRTAARYDKTEALKEMCFGFSFRKFLKDTQKSFDGKKEKLVLAFEKIISLLTRNRLCVGITCPEWEGFAEMLIKTIPEGSGSVGKCKVCTLPLINEGIVAPTHSGYSVRGSNIYLSQEKYHGAMSVFANVLNLDILLEEIRLKGGAYDTGFTARANSGTIAAYSYRDPSTERSVEIFNSIGQKMREFLDTSPDLNLYIISAVGNLDPVSTPRSEGSSATLLHLCGMSHAYTVRLRSEALATSPEQLYELSDTVSEAFRSSTFTVIASKDKLLAMKEKPDVISEL